MIGIYKITCKETGKCYIGQAINIESRWKVHQGKRGKFALSGFDYESVVQCFPEPESLDFWERRCIVDFNAHHTCGGFNLTWGGNGAWGSKNPEETSRKLSVAGIGKHTGPNDSQWAKKISDANRGKTRKQKVVVCRHCNKRGAQGLMKRYHFDNCKEKP